MTVAPSPADLRVSAAACVAALSPLADLDWEVPARDLEWSARTTLNHIARALDFYARQLSSRATDDLPAPGANTDIPVADLIAVVHARALVLADVITASPDDARGWNGGMADAVGFAAMGCDEILVHTFDIATGLGGEFAGPEDVSERVLRRLFPWTAPEVFGWDGLLWANGRIALPDRDRLGPGWGWHCEPLEEWDGTAPTRSVN